MMSAEDPLISVIVAVKNCGATIDACLESFRLQTYSYKELIVVDGASSDSTVETLTRRSSELSYWISEPDAGIYSAWNKGLRVARGDWITFLGADDRFADRDVLQTMASALVDATRLGRRVVYGSISRVNKSGATLGTRTTPWQEAKKGFFSHMTIPHPGLMHHRSLFADHGMFDESFRICGDYELLLRELKEREAFFVPNLVVVAVGVDGLSNDPQNKKVAKKETLRALELHGIRPTYSFSWGDLKGQFGHLLYKTFGRRAFDLARSAYWWLNKMVRRG
jgi:glycosyltransferase involved in cell wall biosynthesis